MIKISYIFSWLLLRHGTRADKSHYCSAHNSYTWHWARCVSMTRKMTCFEFSLASVRMPFIGEIFRRLLTFVIRLLWKYIARAYYPPVYSNRCTAQCIATPTIILNFGEENFCDQKSNHEIQTKIWSCTVFMTAVDTLGRGMGRVVPGSKPPFVI